MNDAYLTDLLADTAERAGGYLRGLAQRAVVPSQDAVDGLTALDTPLPERPTSPEDVIDLLDRIGSPATVASAGPRYFGFVVGSALPVTVAANWLATAWDQNAAVSFLSPVAVALEKIAIGWMVDVFGLPGGSWGGLVSGATMANMTGLAAGRRVILDRHGWDVVAQGMFGAPEVKVVVGEEVHVSVLLALRHLGFGRERLIQVPVDGQGRMRVDSMPELDDSTIVCIQAGNVNSGAFDDATAICELAQDAGAWVHVDGAFGLWAAASPKFAHLTSGFEGADSWAADAHKWLNVPYDCGVVFARNPGDLAGVGALDPAGYLEESSSQEAEPDSFTPQMSRRARGVEVWAALRSLGRSGLADLVDRCCRHAERFAEGLEQAGNTVLNDVVINQVLVSFGDDRTTESVIDEVQSDGTCFMSGTTWHGQRAMRISVSSWATSEDDVEASLRAVLQIAEGSKN